MTADQGSTGQDETRKEPQATMASVVEAVMASLSLTIHAMSTESFIINGTAEKRKSIVVTPQSPLPGHDLDLFNRNIDETMQGFDKKAIHFNSGHMAETGSYVLATAWFYERDALVHVIFYPDAEFADIEGEYRHEIYNPERVRARRRSDRSQTSLSYLGVAIAAEPLQAWKSGKSVAGYYL